jgi:hypothetical protein
MDKVISFMWDARFIIAVLVAFAGFAILEREKANSILYALMLQAKRMAKDEILKSGQEQEDWVVRKALIFLPATVRIFLSEEAIRVIVKFLFNKAKDFLDDGEFNGTNGTGPDIGEGPKG